MSWKFVFNSNGVISKGLLTLNEIAETAQTAGYQFFTFNGSVYFVSDGIISITDITVADLF